MNHIDEATELRERTRKALSALNRMQRDAFTEDEVLFRFDALVGMLIMAANDIDMMVKEWEEDYASLKGNSYEKS